MEKQTEKIKFQKEVHTPLILAVKGCIWTSTPSCIAVKCQNVISLNKESVGRMHKWQMT